MDNKFDGTDVANSIVSCIQQVYKKFGINYIASVLVGSKSEKVVRHRSDKISTHGALSNYSFEQVKIFIKELIQQGFVEQTKDEYPILKLLEKANLVLAGKEQVMLAQPDPDLERKLSAQRGESVAKTVEAYKLGKTVEEIATERKLAQTTILNHLALAFQNGEPVDIEKFVPASKQEAITLAFKKLGTEFLTPVKQSLGPSCTWEELKFVKAKLLREQATISAT